MAVGERDLASVRGDVPWLERLRRRHGVTGWSSEASVLVLAIATLLLFGLLMSFSASFVDGAQAGDPFGVFKRQLTWAAVGVPAFVVVASVDHRSWRPLSWWLIGLALVGLVLVLVPGVGLERFGATRWIGLGPLVVQPTELAKLATLLWLADVLARKRELYGEDMELVHLWVPALPLLALEALLVMLEPDLGTTILIALLVGLVLWIERVPLRFVAVGLGVGLGFVAAATYLASYRMARIDGWLHPEEYASTAGFQLLQSLYALGSGSWFGVGLGSGRGKWDYIPNPETDFIFAIVGEELGLAGALVLLALFGVVLIVGMRIARHAPDRFGRTVAFGITGWVVGQALINVMTVTGLLPITGVTLPLVSVGGSSLLATLVALGILVSIARSATAAGPDAHHRGDRP